MSQFHAHRVSVLLRCRAADGVVTPAGRPVVGHPVEGEVVCEDGSIRPFTGWLGLVNELERIVAGSSAAGAAAG